MKKLKKIPRLQLEKFSNIFMQLGLVLVLFIVFIALEHKTEKADTVAIFNPKDNSDDNVMAISSYSVIPKKVIVPKVNKPKRVVIRKPVSIVKVKKVKNEVEIPEVVNVTPITDLPETTKTVIVKKEEPVNTNPVSMNFVQKAPVFKGCEGLSETENRACFEKKMKRLVQRHFNTGLVDDLNLKRGKNRIITQFVIDKTGTITDVIIRAPHPRLQKEAKRIIRKIPKFKPGYQNNKAVKVKYTLPIGFMVE